MHRLVSYPGIAVPLTEASATLAWVNGALEARFEIGHGGDVLLNGLPDVARTFAPAELSRENGLWQTTCFEAFFGRPGESGYWELNLAARGAWNLYRFDSYRRPQPPAPSEDFAITALEAGPASLRCLLKPKAMRPCALEASLCLVARTALGASYLSVQHAGPKPDFHLRESFSVKVPAPGAS